MSIHPVNCRGRQMEKGCAAEAVCPAPRACGWDIAEDVMYCHGCGALSGTKIAAQNWELLSRAVRTAFFIPLPLRETAGRIKALEAPSKNIRKGFQPLILRRSGRSPAVFLAGFFLIISFERRREKL